MLGRVVRPRCRIVRESIFFCGLRPLSEFLVKQGKRDKYRVVSNDVVRIESERNAENGGLGTILSEVGGVLLPKGFPGTVDGSYLRYSVCAASGAVCSAAAGVLTTQCLLQAVGVGAGSAAVSAAALNWVMKDGLGQLGGMLFASLVNTRFDAEVKKWRMLSAVSLEVSCVLELLTPIFPKLFLPLASLANMGKNISWLSASATRAGLHQGLAKSGNLADVTAKAGSQTIASSLLGMGLGIFVTSCGFPVFPSWAVLASCHLYFVHLALRSVVVPTLNQSRLEACLFQMLPSDPSLPLLPAPTPSELAVLETPFFHFPTPYPDSLPLSINPDLSSLPPSLLHQSLHPNNHYTLIYQPQTSVHLCIHKSAPAHHVILAFVHATLLRTGQHSDPTAARNIAEQITPNLIQHLTQAGWWTAQPLLELDRDKRITVQQIS